MAAFCKPFRGTWRAANFPGCRAPYSPLQVHSRASFFCRGKCSQMLFPQICPKIVLSSSKKLKNTHCSIVIVSSSYKESEKNSNFSSTVNCISKSMQHKEGWDSWKASCCLVCAMIWRFGDKKSSHDLYCRFYALPPHLQLQMSHSPCTQLINITKTLPPHASRLDRITNLTFIFLFSLPAHLCLLSRGGWKEHSDELIVPASCRRSKPCRRAIDLMYQSHCLLGKKRVHMWDSHVEYFLAGRSSARSLIMCRTRNKVPYLSQLLWLYIYYYFHHAHKYFQSAVTF